MRLGRLQQNTKVILRLLAVYAPIALVLVVELHRGPIAKAYFVVGIWAIEGILWYSLGERLAKRRGRADGASRRSECYHWPV